MQAALRNENPAATKTHLQSLCHSCAEPCMKTLLFFKPNTHLLSHNLILCVRHIKCIDVPIKVVRLRNDCVYLWMPVAVGLWLLLQLACLLAHSLVEAVNLRGGAGTGTGAMG